jgi:capsular polysaccharide biosynthesis protein
MEYHEEIDLREIFHNIRRRWRIIVLITALSVIISAFFSFFILQPQYESSATILVGRTQGEFTQDVYQDVILSEKLVKTYGEIMKTSTILDQVIINQGLNTSAGSLAQRISVSTVGDSELLRIRVVDGSPLTAANIANEISRVFIIKIKEIMKVDNVSIIEEASTPVNPIKPNKKMNVLIAGVLGFMVSIFIVFIIDYLDNTIKTTEDIEKHLELPVIGSIPES